MSAFPISSTGTGTVTVQIAEENLLALLGEKAVEKPVSQATPPPLPVTLTEDSPRLVPDLQTAPPASTWSSPRQPSPLLQSAQRRLFQPTVAEPDSWSPDAAPEEASPASYEPKQKPAGVAAAKTQIPDTEAADAGLVLYQAPAASRRAKWLTAAGVAIGLTGIGAYAFVATRQPQGLAVVSPGAEALARYSPLKLQLESREHSLVGIRWDPQSAPVGRASSGRLVILENGGEPRVVPLDVAQLKIGHLYYDTPSDRVEFRLEVTDDAGTVTTESLLALALTPLQTEMAGGLESGPASQVKTPLPQSTATKPAPSDKSAGASKPSARQFAPPATQPEGQSLRAVYLEPPPAGKASSPALSVIAAMPTFNHYVPPSSAPSAAAQKSPETWTACANPSPRGAHLSSQRARRAHRRDRPFHGHHHQGRRGEKFANNLGKCAAGARGERRRQAMALPSDITEWTASRSAHANRHRLHFELVSPVTEEIQ